MSRDFNYRDILHRYSTGKGFSIYTSIPSNRVGYIEDSFKEKTGSKIFCHSEVSLKREADRLSMQQESVLQILKIFGYSSDASSLLSSLTKKIQKIQKLITHYSIEKINKNILDSYLEDKISIKELLKNSSCEGRRSYPIENFESEYDESEYDEFGKKYSLEGFSGSLFWPLIGIVALIIGSNL